MVTLLACAPCYGMQAQDGGYRCARQAHAGPLMIFQDVRAKWSSSHICSLTVYTVCRRGRHAAGARAGRMHAHP